MSSLSFFPFSLPFLMETGLFALQRLEGHLLIYVTKQQQVQIAITLRKYLFSPGFRVYRVFKRSVSLVSKSTLGTKVRLKSVESEHQMNQ